MLQLFHALHSFHISHIQTIQTLHSFHLLKWNNCFKETILILNNKEHAPYKILMRKQLTPLLIKTFLQSYYTFHSH